MIRDLNLVINKSDFTNMVNKSEVCTDKKIRTKATKRRVKDIKIDFNASIAEEITRVIYMPQPIFKPYSVDKSPSELTQCVHPDKNVQNKMGMRMKQKKTKHSSFNQGHILMILSTSFLGVVIGVFIALFVK